MRNDDDDDDDDDDDNNDDNAVAAAAADDDGIQQATVQPSPTITLRIKRFVLVHTVDHNTIQLL